MSAFRTSQEAVLLPVAALCTTTTTAWGQAALADACAITPPTKSTLPTEAKQRNLSTDRLLLKHMGDRTKVATASTTLRWAFDDSSPCSSDGHRCSTSGTRRSASRTK